MLSSEPGSQLDSVVPEMGEMLSTDRGMLWFDRGRGRAVKSLNKQVWTKSCGDLWGHPWVHVEDWGRRTGLEPWRSGRKGERCETEKSSSVPSLKCHLVWLSNSSRRSASVVSDSLQPHGLRHTSFPVLHHLPEFALTHVHWVGDAIRPSHPLLSPSPAFTLSQHQSLF